MPKNRHTPLAELPLSAREAIAENMKERIYATITLLAVIAAHWSQTVTHSVLATEIAVVGTVVALWLATIISIRISYRAVHGRAVSLHEYRHFVFTSSGLLTPALLPFLIILGSLTELYSLHTALFASMIVLLLSLFVLSFSAGRKIYENKWRLIIVSLLEMSVGVGIILLKLAVGE